MECFFWYQDEDCEEEVKKNRPKSKSLRQLTIPSMFAMATAPREQRVHVHVPDVAHDVKRRRTVIVVEPKAVVIDPVAREHRRKYLDSVRSADTVLRIVFGNVFEHRLSGRIEIDKIPLAVAAAVPTLTETIISAFRRPKMGHLMYEAMNTGSPAVVCSTLRLVARKACFESDFYHCVPQAQKFLENVGNWPDVVARRKTPLTPSDISDMNSAVAEFFVELSIRSNTAVWMNSVAVSDYGSNPAFRIYHDALPVGAKIDQSVNSLVRMDAVTHAASRLGDDMDIGWILRAFPVENATLLCLEPVPVSSGISTSSGIYTSFGLFVKTISGLVSIRKATMAYDLIDTELNQNRRMALAGWSIVFLVSDISEVHTNTIESFLDQDPMYIRATLDTLYARSGSLGPYCLRRGFGNVLIMAIKKKEWNFALWLANTAGFGRYDALHAYGDMVPFKKMLKCRDSPIMHLAQAFGVLPRDVSDQIYSYGSDSLLTIAAKYGRVEIIRWVAAAYPKECCPTVETCVETMKKSRDAITYEAAVELAKLRGVTPIESIAPPYGDATTMADFARARPNGMSMLFSAFGIRRNHLVQAEIKHDCVTQSVLALMRMYEDGAVASGEEGLKTLLSPDLWDTKVFEIDEMRNAFKKWPTDKYNNPVFDPDKPVESILVCVQHKLSKTFGSEGLFAFMFGIMPSTKPEDINQKTNENESDGSDDDDDDYEEEEDEH